MSDLSPAAPASEREGMPLEAFLKTMSDGPFGLIQSERRDKVPTSYVHSRGLMRLLFAMHHYLLEHPLGEVFTETAFVLPDQNDPNWVKGSRIPDLLFVNQASIQAYEAALLLLPQWDRRPLMLIPDLVVEVASPDDDPDQLMEKTALYLADGVCEVWIMYPNAGAIALYTQGSGTVRVAYRGDRFPGSAVLPGFALDLNVLFAKGSSQ